MREDNENRPTIARLLQPPAQPRQIARDDGPHIGIHRRGRKAFKFLDLRKNFRRGGDENPRQRLTQRLGCRVFMPRVTPGMQETHRDGFNILRAQLLNGGIEGGVIKRHLHPPIRAQPFAHRKPQAARHQRWRGRQAHIVALRLQPFTHFNHIAVPFRGEHRNLGPLAFQQRIGGNRGAMDDAFCLPQQIGQLHAQCFRQNGEPRDHTFGLIRWRTGGFGQRCGAISGDTNHIGESAADINANTVGHTKPSAASAARAAGSRFSGGPQPPPPPESTCN